MKRIVPLALLAAVFSLTPPVATAQGQPGPAPPRGGRQMVPRPPGPQRPTNLTAEQYQNLLAALAAWEKSSAQVNLMRCTVLVLEYNLTFNTVRKAQGQLKYKAPDKGEYDVTDLANAQQRDHWVCDGKSVFQFLHAQKKVVRRDLPPHLQGSGIGDGPLPFFFGAKADKMMKRYYMTVDTPRDVQDKQVWIYAWPRFQHDAANFRSATVILDRNTMRPLAVEVYSPTAKERTVHKFSDIKIGRNLLEKLFSSSDFDVSAPRGYQLVVNPEQRAASSGRVAPPGRAAMPRGGQRR